MEDAQAYSWLQYASQPQPRPLEIKVETSTLDTQEFALISPPSSPLHLRSVPSEEAAFPSSIAGRKRSFASTPPSSLKRARPYPIVIRDTRHRTEDSKMAHQPYVTWSPGIKGTSTRHHLVEPVSPNRTSSGGDQQIPSSYPMPNTFAAVSQFHTDQRLWCWTHLLVCSTHTVVMQRTVWTQSPRILALERLLRAWQVLWGRHTFHLTPARRLLQRNHRTICKGSIGHRTTLLAYQPKLSTQEHLNKGVACLTTVFPRQLQLHHTYTTKAIISQQSITHRQSHCHHVPHRHRILISNLHTILHAHSLPSKTLSVLVTLIIPRQALCRSTRPLRSTLAPLALPKTHTKMRFAICVKRSGSSSSSTNLPVSDKKTLKWNLPMRFRLPPTATAIMTKPVFHLQSLHLPHNRHLSKPLGKHVPTPVSANSALWTARATPSALGTIRVANVEHILPAWHRQVISTVAAHTKRLYLKRASRGTESVAIIPERAYAWIPRFVTPFWGSYKLDTDTAMVISREMSSLGTGWRVKATPFGNTRPSRECQTHEKTTGVMNADENTLTTYHSHNLCRISWHCLPRSYLSYFAFEPVHLLYSDFSSSWRPFL